MKKLDKLILKSFLGPFFLTFIVVVFILLMQYMLKYFDELVGKGLSASVYAELLFFFSINMTTLALPLAVLLSSLMTFGNLGEHFELTAIKSSGISLTRALVPLLVFSMFLTVLAFINNDQIVPRANLKAYSLLWDIRQTKPSLSLQEGSFYNGIPNYSIKVKKKYPDDVSLKDLIIYDHTKGKGNTDVILADSGRMFTKYNDQYLMLEMFDGQSYSEASSERPSAKEAEAGNFVRNKFKKSVMVFSLESFNMSSTREEYFSGSQVVKNIAQLKTEIDSMQDRIVEKKYTIFQNASAYNTYASLSKIQVPEDLSARFEVIDSLRREREKEARQKADSAGVTYEGGTTETAYFGTNPQRREMLKNSGNPGAVKGAQLKGTAEAEISKDVQQDSVVIAKVEERYSEPTKLLDVYKAAVGQARYMKNSYEIQASGLNDIQKSMYRWQIEVHKKYANAVACLVMFMIGAPLGSIIKRGGLGIPVIISIGFFIIYYVFTIFGEKWAREGFVSPATGIWAANIILLPFGLIFLWQARNDARLFESDFYSVMIARFRSSLGERVRRPRLLRKKAS